MGERLAYFYDRANQLGGLMARVRLAILTDLPSTQAQVVPDDPDTLRRFDEAFARLSQEFSHQTTHASQSQPLNAKHQDSAQSAQMLRRHIQVYLELMSQRSKFQGDFRIACQQITQNAAMTLQVDAVGVWLFNLKQTAITCIDAYDVHTQQHTNGAEIRAEDFPTYFEAIRSERTLAAHNARKDPRTSAFNESYLIPNNVHALLDIPIWSQNKMIGIICHEQRLAPRLWTSDEENFAYLMSGFTGMALERGLNSPLRPTYRGLQESISAM
jgi:hypothetical protein